MKAEKYQTEEFSLNVGVTPGYHHNNEQVGTLESVAKLWQQTAEETFKRTGIYVGATATKTLTLYRQEWGCPDGGEVTVVFSGLMNPAFMTNVAAWKSAVEEVATQVATALDQTTAYPTFRVIEFHYMTSR